MSRTGIEIVGRPPPRAALPLFFPGLSGQVQVRIAHSKLIPCRGWDSQVKILAGRVIKEMNMLKPITILSKYGKVNYSLVLFPTSFLTHTGYFWWYVWKPVWHEGRGYYISIGLGLLAFYRGY